MKEIVLMMLVISSNLIAQTNVLNEYIQIGLENNLVLKQKEFSLQKSLAALGEARGYFLPSLDINARYTRADGGRTIEFPVGDLLNPVYQTLNQLTGQQVFPTIANEEIKFIRKEEHETKIQLVQPIFQPEIYYNYRIKRNLSEMEKAERDTYANVLISDIKAAYYQYLITIKVLEIANGTEEILRENLRVSQSLVDNEKATIDAVYRAKAELSKFLQSKNEMERDNDLAAAYFNFLLNREQDAPIQIEKTSAIDYNAIPLEEIISTALNRRNEFRKLAAAKDAADNSLSLSKSKFLPTVVFAADYGFQGEKYKFTSEYDFWTASLVLQWNLFKGFSDKNKIEQAEWDLKNLEAQRKDVENKIRLQVREAYYNFITAGKSIETAEDQLQSAKKTFEIIGKKFKEGMAAQIEFIDARNTLTQAEINNVIKHFDQKIKLSELEKVMAINQGIEK